MEGEKISNTLYEIISGQFMVFLQIFANVKKVLVPELDPPTTLVLFASSNGGWLNQGPPPAPQ